MWDRTPFPVTQTAGSFAPHAANNVFIVARKPRAAAQGRNPAEPELRAIHVGSGAALSELVACANREDIVQNLDNQYELVAFSCFVGDALREGTAKFLAEDLAPLLPDAHADARVYRINLPAVQWERPGAQPTPLRKAG